MSSIDVRCDVIRTEQNKIIWTASDLKSPVELFQGKEIWSL